MGFLLTEGSVVKCAHGGTVQLHAGQSVLKIDAKAVLVMGDMIGAAISGCLVAASSAPCTAVISMLAGAATNMKAGQRAVLLDSASGMTNGVPPATWKVASAGHTKMSAG